MKINNCHFSKPPTEKGEVWKDVVGYEGLYLVSNKGRVWSVLRPNRGRLFGGYLMRFGIDKRGRCIVVLNKDNKSRTFIPARLVAIAFIRDPKPNEEVNHKDENPLNNCLENLEWCTHKYNCNYGTRIQRIKEKQNMAILQYTLNGEFIAEYDSMHIAAETIKADAGHICDCCSGKRKWAYGFFWRYKDETLYNQAKERIERKVASSKKSRAEKFEANALNVIQLDTEGNLVAIHQSSRKAAQSVNGFTSGIINCCNGKQSSHKGFCWVYERDYHKPKSNYQQLSLF